MDIATDTVVTLDYTLTDDTGEVLDSSEDEPLVYLHGHGHLVAGLESKLTGHRVGDTLHIDVAAEDGYGERDAGRMMQIKPDELPSDLKPEIGMELATEGPGGEQVSLWITDISPNSITLDANHPLAGQTLHFDVRVLGIRQASKDELQHGHAHTPGHDHH